MIHSEGNLLTDQVKNEQGGSSTNEESTRSQSILPSLKKTFIEPELSQPVDVLEATAFFQAVDSGPTN